MTEQANAPIIIKRKKVIAGGGHHGGAWKVAYADFVTAMMAFFMLMWLLNATTETQRKGIADYFSPTAPIYRISGGGEGMFGGDSIFTRESLASSGNGANTQTTGSSAANIMTPEEKDAQTAQLAEVKALRDIEEILLARGGESSVSERALRHIVTRVTDEGLIIEIFDRQDAALFVSGEDTPNKVTEEIAAMVARLLQRVENGVAINAYLSAMPVVVMNNPVWDLSVSRANRMRLLLEAGGLDGARVSRLTGAGDRTPAVSDSTAARNSRIEVIVLRTPNP